MRFTITWYNEGNGEYVGYKVSIPSYEGGEVVSVDEVEEIEDALAAAQKKIEENGLLIRELQVLVSRLQQDDKGHS